MTARPTFEEICAEGAAARAAWEAVVRVWDGLPGVAFDDDRPGQWILVHRATSGPCEWRTTHGRGDQPHGHTEARTFAAAMEDARAMGARMDTARDPRADGGAA